MAKGNKGTQDVGGCLSRGRRLEREGGTKGKRGWVGAGGAPGRARTEGTAGACTILWGKGEKRATENPLRGKVTL